MQRLIQANQVSQVLEIGSWLGKSTRHIANLLPEGGKVTAVDTWEGSEEHLDDPMLTSMLPTLYDQFLSNVIHSGLTDKIEPLKMTSLDASIQLQGSFFDLIYIDAAHATEFVMKDLKAFFPYVEAGRGILCGDDWGWDTVRPAVLAFALYNGLSIYAGTNFWFLKEEGTYKVQTFEESPEEIWYFKKPKRNEC